MLAIRSDETSSCSFVLHGVSSIVVALAARVHACWQVKKKSVPPGAMMPLLMTAYFQWWLAIHVGRKSEAMMREGWRYWASWSEMLMTLTRDIDSGPSPGTVMNAIVSTGSSSVLWWCARCDHWHWTRSTKQPIIMLTAHHKCMDKSRPTSSE